MCCSPTSSQLSSASSSRWKRGRAEFECSNPRAWMSYSSPCSTAVKRASSPESPPRPSCDQLPFVHLEPVRAIYVSARQCSSAPPLLWPAPCSASVILTQPLLNAMSREQRVAHNGHRALATSTCTGTCTHSSTRTHASSLGCIRARRGLSLLLLRGALRLHLDRQLIFASSLSPCPCTGTLGVRVF